LHTGTVQAGVWAIEFPLGIVVRQVTVMAGDALFNEVAQVISW